MPKKRAYFSLQLYARQKTKQAFDTIVNIMEQPKTPPAARLMAAGMIIDRGWGKAAQVLAIDGEIRQLVEVKLNVVQPKTLDATATKLITNPEKPNEINNGHLSPHQVADKEPGDAK
jgi:hypothetical protein